MFCLHVSFSLLLSNLFQPFLFLKAFFYLLRQNGQTIKDLKNAWPSPSPCPPSSFPHHPHPSPRSATTLSPSCPFQISPGAAFSLFRTCRISLSLSLFFFPTVQRRHPTMYSHKSAYSCISLFPPRVSTQSSSRVDPVSVSQREKIKAFIFFKKTALPHPIPLNTAFSLPKLCPALLFSSPPLSQHRLVPVRLYPHLPREGKARLGFVLNTIQRCKKREKGQRNWPWSQKGNWSGRSETYRLNVCFMALHLPTPFF